MDLKQLQAMGAFVPRTLIKRTLAVRRPVLAPESDWTNPNEPEFTGEFVNDTVDVWIRKRTSADFLEMVQAPDRDKAHIAILRCWCDEGGAETLQSLEQAKQMAEWLFAPLLDAVNKANEFGLKNSPPRTKSGLSSPSSSAVRSRKLKRGSRNKSSKPSGSRIAPSAAP